MRFFCLFCFLNFDVCREQVYFCVYEHIIQFISECIMDCTDSHQPEAQLCANPINTKANSTPQKSPHRLLSSVHQQGSE